MKKIGIILFSILTIYGCNPTETANKVDLEDIKTKIDSLLNNWHKDAANADLDNYIGFMDSLSVYIGTDANENWTKEEFREFCQPYFKKQTTWSFEVLKRNISLSENNETAWFEEILKTHMGVCRGSGVLEKNNNNWKLKQYILSVAIPNENMKDVIKIKSKNDSIILKQYEI